MNPILALVLTATLAADPVPRDLFLDYTHCTEGRENCAAALEEANDLLADCNADLEADEPTPATSTAASTSIWSILGLNEPGAVITLIVVAAAAAFATGVVVGSK